MMQRHNKESRNLAQHKETLKIQITTVHDIDGTDFRDQAIKDVDFMDFTVSNRNKGWYTCPEIKQRVQFDGSFGFTKFCPRKNRQAQIYNSSVQGINRFIQLNTEVFICIEFSGMAN